MTHPTLLFKQAHLHRRHAERARRLACSFTSGDVIERLEQFARELDGKAIQLEERARQAETRPPVPHPKVHPAPVERESAIPANDNRFAADD